jgi:sterol desaturase/sphingolipid hydroxylase (fatty acid hydroxylase superfamily)
MDDTCGTGSFRSESYIDDGARLEVYGFVTSLVADMIFYFTQLLGHRTQIGWAFHKAHHSAAVLTPLMRYREHFVGGIRYGAGAAAGLGLCGGRYSHKEQFSC